MTMGNPDKHRWPREIAWPLAVALMDELSPACERIIIAGSLRREKPTVGDIELLYIPAIRNLPNHASLFAEDVPTNLADLVIERLEKQRVLSRRVSAAGHTAFGEKNKLMLHHPTGIPVDLFSTTEEAFENYLVCRTGPAELNVAICDAAIERGWKWAPYGIGFVRPDQPPLVVKKERDVFEYVGLPYREPNQR